MTGTEIKQMLSIIKVAKPQLRLDDDVINGFATLLILDNVTPEELDYSVGKFIKYENFVDYANLWKYIEEFRNNTPKLDMHEILLDMVRLGIDVNRTQYRNQHLERAVNGDPELISIGKKLYNKYEDRINTRRQRNESEAFLKKEINEEFTTLLEQTKMDNVKLGYEERVKIGG